MLINMELYDFVYQITLWMKQKLVILGSQLNKVMPQP
jgi:hypothetical protein